MHDYQRSQFKCETSTLSHKTKLVTQCVVEKLIGTHTLLNK